MDALAELFASVEFVYVNGTPEAVEIFKTMIFAARDAVQRSPITDVLYVDHETFHDAAYKHH